MGSSANRGQKAILNTASEFCIDPGNMAPVYDMFCCDASNELCRFNQRIGAMGNEDTILIACTASRMRTIGIGHVQGIFPHEFVHAERRRET